MKNLYFKLEDYVVWVLVIIIIVIILPWILTSLFLKDDVDLGRY